MADENLISVKTWERAADLISKVGYMDGAADGQKATFQTSFDKGYKLGFSLGIEVGKKDASLSVQNLEKSDDLKLRDPRGINCYMCLNSTKTQDNIVNLYNEQKEKNDKYLDYGIKI